MRPLKGNAMKLANLAALLLAAALIFSGCHKEEKRASVPSEPDKPPEPVEEPDPNWPAEAAGVVLEEKPETIVSLSPALTEIVYELGGTLSGISDYCDYPPEVSSLERYGVAGSPALEALETLEPDLVLSSTPLPKAGLERLEALEISVAVFPRADGLDGMEETYIALATLLGGAEDGPAHGKEVFGALRGRYDALVSSAGEPQISGIWLRAAPLLMATGDTLEGSLLEKALGVKNDAAEYEGWQYPQEKAVDLYPDVIFYDQSIDPAYFGSTQVYSTTDAYKQGRMYSFDSLPFERQSGRMFDQLEQMAARLRGGAPAAEDPDTAAAG